MSTRSVSLVKKGDSAEPIEVRVIRRWRSFVFKDDSCYVFVDKEGYAIEGHGNRRDIEDKLNVGRCYKISRYISDGHKKSHNIVPHPATIKLGRGTRFETISSAGFPENYFNLTLYEGLSQKLDETFLLTDYIGRFDTITSDQITRSGRRLLKFTLEDAQERFIEVALWGEIAQTVDTNRLTHEEFPCIIVVTSMKVTKYNQLQLESTSATHVYINPNYHEASELAESMRLMHGDAPVPNQNMLTIDELSQKNPTTNAERLFNCRASVTGFMCGKPWFYKGCPTCNRKLSKKGHELACENHPDETQPKYIYCVHATIADNTGSTTVTMFDLPILSLITTTCSTMVIQEGYTDPDVIPEPLQAIKGLNRLFELKFNNRGIPGSAAFKVTRLIDDAEIPTAEAEINQVAGQDSPLPTAASIEQGATPAEQIQPKTAPEKETTPMAGKQPPKHPATPAIHPQAKRKLSINEGTTTSKKTPK